MKRSSNEDAFGYPVNKKQRTRSTAQEPEEEADEGEPPQDHPPNVSRAGQEAGLDLNEGRESDQIADFEFNWLQPDPIVQASGRPRRSEEMVHTYPTNWHQHPHPQQGGFFPVSSGRGVPQGSAVEPGHRSFHTRWEQPDVSDLLSRLDIPPPSHSSSDNFSSAPCPQPPMMPPYYPGGQPGMHYAMYHAYPGSLHRVPTNDSSTSSLPPPHQGMYAAPAPSFAAQEAPAPAIAESSPIVRITGENTVVPLSLTSDANSLSEYHCTVRNQIELFAATQYEIDSNMQGRNRPIVVKQVGIRCKWCAARIPGGRKPRGAVYYPSKLSGLYQAAQNMTINHFTKSCTSIPPDLKEKLCQLKEKKTYQLGGGKGYWATGGRICGLREMDNRLFFKDHIPGVATAPEAAHETADGST